MKVACMLGMYDINFSTKHVFLLIDEDYYYLFILVLLCNLIYYMCFFFIYFILFYLFIYLFYVFTHSCTIDNITEKSHFLHHNSTLCNLVLVYSTFNEKHSSEILLKLTQNVFKP